MFAQSTDPVVIGENKKGDPNATLEVVSKNGTAGFMPPRFTTTQIATLQAKLTADSKGLMVFNTDENCLKMWLGTAWSGCSGVAETTTTLTKNVIADKANPGALYTYKNEKGMESDLDIVKDVADWFHLITAKERPISESGWNPYGQIQDIIRETESNGILEIDDSPLYNVPVLNLRDGQIGPDGKRPVTSFVFLSDLQGHASLEKYSPGRYQYTNTAGDGSTNIDIFQDLADSFQLFLETQPGEETGASTPRDELTRLVLETQTKTRLSYDQDKNALIYSAELDGGDQAINIYEVPLPTPAVDYVPGSYFAFNPVDNSPQTMIEFKDIISSNTKDILVVTGGEGAALATTSIGIVPAKTKGEVLTTVTDENNALIVEWTSPAKTNVQGIKVLKTDYTVTDSDYTIIARNLQSDILLNLPEASSNKGRMLIINQNNTQYNGNPVKVNFNTSVEYSTTSKLDYLTNNPLGAIGSSAKIALQSDGINWYVISSSL